MIHIHVHMHANTHKQTHTDLNTQTPRGLFIETIIGFPTRTFVWVQTIHGNVEVCCVQAVLAAPTYPPLGCHADTLKVNILSL